MTIDGGAGNDTIAFYQAGTNQPETVYRSSTLVGGQGTDSINMEVASGSSNRRCLVVGNDTIFLDFASGSAFTAAGGGGDDAISFIADSASNSFLGGDVEDWPFPIGTVTTASPAASRGFRRHRFRRWW